MTLRAHDLHLPELTLRGMLLGALITVIFTASNVYLGFEGRFDVLVIHSRQLLFQWQFYGSSRILMFLKITWLQTQASGWYISPPLSLFCQVYSCLGIGMAFHSGKHSCSVPCRLSG